MYENVKKLPTNIYGLKYKPSLEPNYSDNADTVPEFMRTIKKSHKGMTDKELKIISQVLNRVKPKCILEIGVAWEKNSEKQQEEWKLDSKYLNHTSTGLFLKTKGYYLGIDLNDRSYHHNPKEFKYFFQTDSRNIELVMNRLRALGIWEIDLIMIDGHHSVNMTANDWQYSKYLSQDGVILLHDTNVHPGNYTIFDAIDETLFTKKKYFSKDKDTFGIAVIERKQASTKNDWWKNV